MHYRVSVWKNVLYITFMHELYTKITYYVKTNSCAAFYLCIWQCLIRGKA